MFKLKIEILVNSFLNVLCLKNYVFLLNIFEYFISIKIKSFHWTFIRYINQRQMFSPDSNKYSFLSTFDFPFELKLAINNILCV